MLRKEEERKRIIWSLANADDLQESRVRTRSCHSFRSYVSLVVLCDRHSSTRIEVPVVGNHNVTRNSEDEVFSLYSEADKEDGWCQKQLKQ